MHDAVDFDDTPHDDDWNGTRVDRLISRIVDRRAEPDEWSEFSSIARADSAHWEALLATLRADGALRAGLASALATADEVETPVPSLSRWRQWTGWAAASVLAVCWAGTSGLDPAAPAVSPTPLAAPPSVIADSGVSASDPSGTSACEELPLRLVGTRPGPDGRGVEVLYVRPVVERAVVDGVYSMGTDELGRPAAVQVDPALLVASNKL